MTDATATVSQLERLGDHLKKLRLRKCAERLEALLQHAAAQELPYADFLEQVLGEEVAAKRTQNISMRTAMARFPLVKPLETFDSPTSPPSTRSRCSAWPTATSSSMATTCWCSALPVWARLTWRSAGA